MKSRFRSIVINYLLYVCSYLSYDHNYITTIPPTVNKFGMQCLWFMVVFGRLHSLVDQLPRHFATSFSRWRLMTTNDQSHVRNCFVSLNIVQREEIRYKPITDHRGKISELSNIHRGWSSYQISFYHRGKIRQQPLQKKEQRVPIVHRGECREKHRGDLKAGCLCCERQIKQRPSRPQCALLVYVLMNVTLIAFHTRSYYVSSYQRRLKVK